MFQGSFKGLSINSKGCFKEASKRFQENFRGVLRVIKRFKEYIGCFNCVNDVSRFFQGSFKFISGKYRCFNYVLRLFEDDLKIYMVQKQCCLCQNEDNLNDEDNQKSKGNLQILKRP